MKLRQLATAAWFLLFGYPAARVLLDETHGGTRRMRVEVDAAGGVWEIDLRPELDAVIDVRAYTETRARSGLVPIVAKMLADAEGLTPA